MKMRVLPLSISYLPAISSMRVLLVKGFLGWEKMMNSCWEFFHMAVGSSAAVGSRCPTRTVFSVVPSANYPPPVIRTVSSSLSFVPSAVA